MKEDIIDYYNVCWLDRFNKGHNAKSLAMHLGYFEDELHTDNDEAKNKTNQLIADLMDKKHTDSLHIADFGCGIGGTCFFLAEKFKNASIYGINISVQQLEFAKNQKRVSDNIKFIHSSYTNSTLDNNSMDFVIGIESFCHAESKQSVFNEVFRVLRKGGKLIVFDYVESRNAETSIESTLLNEFRLGWAVNQYIKNEPELLTNSGFSSIKSTSIIEKVMPGINKSYYKAMANLPTTTNDLIKSHMKACIALKKLVDLGIIDYKVIIAIK